MELTGDAQPDLRPDGAVILQGGGAQVAALISGRHLHDVQGPVRQQGQSLPARRGAQLRANELPSIFGPGGGPGRRSAGGGTRKSHDVAGGDRQCQVVGTAGPKCGCDKPGDGETSTVRRLRRSPVSPGRPLALKTHQSSTNTRVEKIELRGSSWSTFQHGPRQGGTNGFQFKPVRLVHLCEPLCNRDKHALHQWAHHAPQHATQQ